MARVPLLPSDTPRPAYGQKGMPLLSLRQPLKEKVLQAFRGFLSKVPKQFALSDLPRGVELVGHR